MDDEVARMAALKSLNQSIHNSLAEMQFANSIILQTLVAVMERQVGPEVRPAVISGLKETWEASHRALGDDHPIASGTREILQMFINSLEGK